MFFTLLKKELLDHLLSFRFAVGSIICLVLMIVSLLVLKGDFLLARESYVSNTQTYKEQAEQAGNYTSLGWQGIQVDRPPPELQVQVYGVERESERTANINLSGMPKIVRQGDINPVVNLFPIADLAYVVAAVLSLLVFVFSYDALTAERESETIKLLFSYSVPRDTVLLAKGIAGFLAASVPFILASFMGGIIILASGGIAFEQHDWRAYGLILTVSLILIATLSSLGLLVSVCCRHSATSISLLVFLWAAFVMVVPQMSPFVGDILSPIRNLSLVENEIRKETDVFQREMWMQFSTRGADLRSKMRQDNEEGRAARQQFYALMTELREEVNKKTEEVQEARMKVYNREQDRQVQFTKGISLVSPIACYVYAVSDIAGTGIRKKQHFYENLNLYKNQFEEFLQVKAAEESASGGGGFGMMGRGRARQDQIDLSDMPQFHYQEETVNQRLAGSVWDIGFVGAYGILFFFLAFFVFHRSSII